MSKLEKKGAKIIHPVYKMFHLLSDGVLTFSSLSTTAAKYNGGEWPFGRYGCKILSFISFIFMNASRFSVVLLAFDRFLAVIPDKVSKKRWRSSSFANFLCIGMWCFSILASSYTLLLRDNKIEGGITKCVWVLANHNLP